MHCSVKLRAISVQLWTWRGAANAPKAVLSMTGVLDDPSALGTREKLAASKEILDRVGLVKTEKVEVKADKSAVLILPPLKYDDEDDASE
jgi:hypothetical protein